MEILEKKTGIKKSKEKKEEKKEKPEKTTSM
jgi:hypothetical protein